MNSSSIFRSQFHSPGGSVRRTFWRPCRTRRGSTGRTGPGRGWCRRRRSPDRWGWTPATKLWLNSCTFLFRRVTKNRATVLFYFYILVEKEKVPDPALYQVLHPTGCGSAILSPTITIVACTRILTTLFFLCGVKMNENAFFHFSENKKIFHFCKQYCTRKRRCFANTDFLPTSENEKFRFSQVRYLEGGRCSIRRVEIRSGF